ncbi:hypothetical protein F4782DRAFT_524557 [Xylaria castorea]|nr:hypothetical protein F4782DRAFT_524557 [Xylaria castorea]
MSHLYSYSYSTSLYRSQSPVSVAASDTTYHSFHDVELFEPASPVATLRIPPQKAEQSEPKPQQITRHDSGYESTYSGSSHSQSPGMSNRNASRTRRQKRPSVQRAAKSTPTSYPRRLSGQSLRMPTPQQNQQPNSYYYFPSPEEINGGDEADEETEQVYHPPPPRTTHYWTSDHTRRLEYAAIDAASCGVKGWVMKHVVPDCLVPKDNRRLTFDDDTGSNDEIPEKLKELVKIAETEIAPFQTQCAAEHYKRWAKARNAEAADGIFMPLRALATNEPTHGFLLNSYEIEQMSGELTEQEIDEITQLLGFDSSGEGLTMSEKRELMLYLATGKMPVD